MEYWQQTINCLIFHDFQPTINSRPVISLIDEMIDMISPLITRGQLSLTFTESFRPKRIKLNERNLLNAKLLIPQGKIRTLFISSLDSTDIVNLGFAFQSLVQDPNSPRHGESRYGSMGLWIDCNLLNNDWSLEQCHLFMKKSWEKLDGIYGFVDKFITHRTGAFSQIEQLDASSRLLAKPLSFSTSHPSINIAKNIPDCYWLNYLNANHLSKLNGLDTLSKMVMNYLPTGVVESLATGGAAIQISPSPQYIDEFEWREHHKKIEKILFPLVQSTSI